MAEECKNLPDDVFFNIFIRLPVKTIGVCCCVCKSWQSVIYTPLFMNNHLITTTITPKEDTRNYMVFRYPEVHLYSFDGSETVAEPKKLRYRASSRDPKYLVGCCNGLVCIIGNKVSRDYYHVLLWNPLIKKIKIIKKSNAIWSECAREKLVLGFGFVGDFKVVKLEYYKSNPDLPRVEVYSLGTDSWRTITEIPNCKVIGNQEDQSPNAFVRGCVHWIADRKQKGRVILCFDMKAEEFREIELPDISTDSRSVRVTRFRDSLALFVDSGPINDNSRQFDIWVMKDYGVGGSWSRLVRLGRRDGSEIWEIMNREVYMIRWKNVVISAGVAGAYEESLALLNDDGITL